MKKNNDNIPLNYREKSNSRIALICSVAVLAVLVLVFRQLDYSLIQKPLDEAKKLEAQKKEEEKKAAELPKVTTASVVAVGDNLFHQVLIDSGRSDSGQWNYDHIYANVTDEIQAADVAMVDQETVFTTDHSAVSGYPSFATPTEVGDALVKAGFDVIESATNHIDDYGTSYISDTLNFWKTNYPEVPVLGIHDSQEDADTVKALEVNGIKIAFLDYTYGTNNGGAGEGNDYMIDLLDTQKVSAMIKKAKASSDCLIFVAHWGKEQEPMPTEYEKEWANFLMEQGVDVLIGGHPHVLQPYGWMSDEQGNQMLVFYSLGNFVSNQESLSSLLEGMGSFTIQKSTKDGKSTVEILDPVVKPMVMHCDPTTGEFGPYMLEDYTEELAAKHSVRETLGEEFSLQNLKDRFQEIMSMNVTPSTRTDLLDVSFDSDLNMTDKDGNYVEDTWSTTAEQYWQEKENGGGDDGSEDGSSGSGEDGSGEDEDSGDYEDSGEY